MCVVKKGDVERHGFLDSKQGLSDLFSGDFDAFRGVFSFSLHAMRARSFHAAFIERSIVP